MTTTPLPDLTWHVTDTKGDPVTTLAGLAEAMGGIEAKDAAAALLSGPFTACAPPALVAEAEAAQAKTTPDIGHGTFVTFGDERGRVDLVVTNGTVPGVDGAAEGTKASPAARVVVYEKAENGWKATARKVAAPVADLERIGALPGARTGKKSVQDELADVRAEAEALADGRGLGEGVVPATTTLLEVYERGVKAWPGSDATELDVRAWALGRARAFCAKALGDDVEGYHRDDDLLSGADGRDGEAAVEDEDTAAAAYGTDAPGATGDTGDDSGGDGDGDGEGEQNTDIVEDNTGQTRNAPAGTAEPEAEAEGKSLMTPAEVAALLARFES